MPFSGEVIRKEGEMSPLHTEVAGSWMCLNPKCGLMFNWDRYHTKAVYCLFDKAKKTDQKIGKPMGGGVRPYFCPECGGTEIQKTGDSNC